MSNWIPKEGEEVQVKFFDGFVEIAKFISDNDDGTCEVRIGRKQRHKVQCRQVYQNCPPYKRQKQERFVSRVKQEDFDEKEYLY